MTRVPVTIRDPIVEPLWSGTRVLAHVDTHARPMACPACSPHRRSMGSTSDPTSRRSSRPSVGASLLADDAVLDGSRSPTRRPGRRGHCHRDRGADLRDGHPDVPRRGHRGASAGGPDDGLTPTRRSWPSTCCVSTASRCSTCRCWSASGCSRASSSQGPLVRVSVMCRPPIDGWVASWQGAGLRGGMMKAANGRYIPGDRTPEWRAITRVGGATLRAGTALFGRSIGRSSG